MKKILFLVLGLFLFAGCDALSNTPTKRVEMLLDKYKAQDATVLTQLDSVVKNDTTMSEEQKLNYIDAMKRQYSNLAYTVKDEKIDGNNATVTVEIEVYDYNKVNTYADTYLKDNADKFNDETGQYSEKLFMDYKLSEMAKATDKIKYTIDFTTTKTNGKWVVNDLTDVDRQKIHGIYAS